MKDIYNSLLVEVKKVTNKKLTRKDIKNMSFYLLYGGKKITTDTLYKSLNDWKPLMKNSLDE